MKEILLQCRATSFFLSQPRRENPFPAVPHCVCQCERGCQMERAKTFWGQRANASPFFFAVPSLLCPVCFSSSLSHLYFTNSVFKQQCRHVLSLWGGVAHEKPITTCYEIMRLSSLVVENGTPALCGPLYRSVAVARCVPHRLYLPSPFAPSCSTIQVRRFFWRKFST